MSIGVLNFKNGFQSALEMVENHDRTQSPEFSEFCRSIGVPDNFDEVI